MQNQLQKEVRFLKIYVVVSSLVFLVLIATAFKLDVPQKTKFGEIDVERINVIEPNGKLDLVISNSERMPPPIVGGKTFPRNGRSPGMLFYNGKGDEDGGLGFNSRTTADGKYEASGQVMFDQYNNDQIVGIQYSDNNGSRSAGFRVWDRSDTPLDQIMAKVDGLQGAERQAALKKLADAGQIGASRVFVGKLPDNSAEVVLSDSKGHPRLTLSVASDGNAQLKFLDEAGKTTYTLTPPN
jgi:hypothetical protein